MILLHVVAFIFFVSVLWDRDRFIMEIDSDDSE